MADDKTTETTPSKPGPHSPTHEPAPDPGDSLRADGHHPDDAPNDPLIQPPGKG